MREMPYIPFYVADFIGGTAGMTASTKGVYITLLCLMYEAERPISLSWETLARQCGCTRPAFEAAVSRLVEDGKVEVNGLEIWSHTCDKHLALRRQRRNSASASAKARWGKSEENQREADANALRSECCARASEAETDTDISPDGDIPPVDPPRSKPAKARMVEGWMPSAAGEEYARSMGMSETEIRECADDFSAYWSDRTDRDGSKSARGWDAAWRNNVQRWAQRNRRGMAGTAAGPGRGGCTSIASIVARRRARDEP